MKKIFYGVIFLLVSLSFIFLNFGKLIDSTDKPVKSDLIVCLGGGDIERLKKSVELYLQEYSKSDTLLFTGDDITASAKQKGHKDARIGYMKKHHSQIKFFHNPNTDSTGAEVKFIKKYMKEYGYKSALIVTDPPHSGRITILTSLISVEGDNNMTFHMIDSGVEWWNRESYYKNSFARAYAMDELIKISYNFVAYGVLDKIGLLDEVKEWRKVK